MLSQRQATAVGPGLFTVSGACRVSHVLHTADSEIVTLQTTALTVIRSRVKDTRGHGKILAFRKINVLKEHLSYW